MRHLSAALFLIAFCTVSAHANSARRDARMDGYLAIWSRNATITPATVDRLYAQHVDYYGHLMSATAVYRDKLAFVRQWPSRRYAAVPGSVTNDCSNEVMRCRVSALLRWTRADRSGRHQSGTSTVRLDLARENGTLQIVRESGEAVGQR